jgi:hypothetical protein
MRIQIQALPHTKSLTFKDHLLIPFNILCLFLKYVSKIQIQEVIVSNIPYSQGGRIAFSDGVFQNPDPDQREPMTSSYDLATRGA